MERKNLISYIFGGTKKAWILLFGAALLSSFACEIEVPSEFIVLYATVVSFYFGAGGVKLGNELKKE